MLALEKLANPPEFTQMPAQSVVLGVLLEDVNVTRFISDPLAFITPSTVSLVPGLKTTDTPASTVRFPVGSTVTSPTT
jgi:hypothetical protein